MEAMTVMLGCCRNPLVRLLKPIPATVEQDAETEQYVASFSRGDCDEWGHGDTRSAAFEDLVSCAAETFLFLNGMSNDRMSGHLQMQKSIMNEYFVVARPNPPAPPPNVRFKKGG